MAHEVERMAYVGARPWHGLGTELAEHQTCEAMLRPAGLDWTVSPQPMFTEWGLVPDHRAVKRDDTNAVIGVVGKGWGPVQNATLAATGDAIAGEGEAWCETAASLRNGKVVFFCLRLPESMTIKGDEGGGQVDRYLVLTAAHDGTRAVRLLFTPIRVVCANTLGAAIGRAKNMISVAHTVNVDQRLKAAQAAMKAAVSYFARFKVLAEKMIETKYTTAQFTSLTEVVAPTPPPKAATVLSAADALAAVLDETAGRNAVADNLIPESVIAARDTMTRLYTQGAGAMPGTAWGAFNAACDYLDHARAYQDSAARSASEGRTESLLLGGAQNQRNLALETILQQVDLRA